jgi:hypothetical protein
MHKTILDTPFSANSEGGFHTAVVDDIPEDTDVFYVLSRKPSVPEWILTSKYVYLVKPDGAIQYLMTVEAFQKVNRQGQK